MRISELAKKAGCTVESIRFYENHDLIPCPPRTESNYRVYGPAHLSRLLFIRHCRSLDLSLNEIRTLADVVENSEKGELIRAHTIVEEHLKAIDQKIEDLNHLRDQLNSLHSRCHGEDHDHGRCGLIEELTK